jgi:transcription initiation factor TFIIE subunit alpha
MLDKLLYDLAERIVGKNGKDIVDILKDKRDVNEFKIAKKLKLTINQVRNLLYKLDAQDIVTFVRKKDKRKGWYIYYWSLDVPKALKLLAKIKEREIQQFNNMLKSHENKRFFLCKGCEIELTEENALNHNFICPECGNLLQLSDNREKILEIKREIEKESRILQTIRDEINKLSIAEAKKVKKSPLKAPFKRSLGKKRKKALGKKQKKPWKETRRKIKKKKLKRKIKVKVKKSKGKANKKIKAKPKKELKQVKKKGKIRRRKKSGKK